ncbi:MAG: hypothetical protein V4641_01925 [Pseudomonadota bacterium]
MKNFPESYDDPVYASLDAGNEQKLALPVGLLASIRTAGERSNASATNKFGTGSPYQFTPPTRKAILDKYGIDVLLSPENASEGAGLLLQESLKRHKGDVETAVREYHGGTNPDNWGPVNNAYAKRVLAAQGSAKNQALDSAFIKFMTDNPAIPANHDQAPAPAAPVDDRLGTAFTQFMAQKAAAPKPAAPPADPTLVDKLIGGGETALTLGTGAIGGALGGVGGFVGGLAGQVMSGQFGTQEGIRNVEDATVSGMNSLTYHPRTQVGQEYAGNVGEAMQEILPALPLTAELGAIGRGASAAGRIGMDAGAAGIQRLRAAAPAIAERVDRTLRRNPLPEAAPAVDAAPLTAEQTARLAQLDEHVAGAPSRRVTAQDGTPLELPGRAPRRLTEAEAAEQTTLQAQRAAQEAADAAPPTPTPGTQGSAGASGTDMIAQRRELAAKVGVEPTYGQLTRDHDQLRFEQEMAKSAQGGKVRERYSAQNEQVMKHFDNLVDMTGAEAADVIGTGRIVDQALRKELAKDKNAVRVGYQKADTSAEAGAPVTLSDAVQFLNDSAPDEAVSSLLVAARARALKLGIAEQGADGALTALPTTVKNAELFRRAVGGATDYEPTNMRNSAIIKGAVDAATEPVAGPLYRNARRLRENLGNKYENRGVIASLLNNKRGMNDRKVAIEDVFKHSILDSTRADVGQVRRILQTGGETGQQAWRELQGATVNWIKDEAFANTATDQRGNVILSVPKLEKAIKKLDADGKLDFIFGKQGAQHFRDVNELAKVIYTAPPGAVNHSNTASVLLAAMTEAGVNGSITGLPVPVLSALKAISVQVKNHKIRKRIDQALAGRSSSNSQPAAAPAAPRTLH